MTSEPVEVDPATIRRVLRDATGSVEVLAEAVGVVPATLWAWAAGRRRPQRENLEALADALERRGGELLELAQEIREAAEKG